MNTHSGDAKSCVSTFIHSDGIYLKTSYHNNGGSL